MVDTSSNASALTYDVVADGVERHTEVRLPDRGPIVSSSRPGWRGRPVSDGGASDNG
ncbi:UNVERIFIED_ORG: hypothetical protein L601_000100001500 [Gordonia westfalica J30]